MVRERDSCCIFCPIEKINAHHVIPREVSDTRHNLLNGVGLCAGHHKFKLWSAHRNPAWFLKALQQVRPDIYNFVMDNIAVLQIKYKEKI